MSATLLAHDELGAEFPEAPYGHPFRAELRNWLTTTRVARRNPLRTVMIFVAVCFAVIVVLSRRYLTRI